MFGIRHPIIPRVACTMSALPNSQSAVSNAGGLGIIASRYTEDAGIVGEGNCALSRYDRRAVRREPDLFLPTLLVAALSGVHRSRSSKVASRLSRPPGAAPSNTYRHSKRPASKSFTNARRFATRSRPNELAATQLVSTASNVAVILAKTMSPIRFSPRAKPMN